MAAKRKARTPQRKPTDQRLNKSAWAVMDDAAGTRLALWDGRLPIFWLRRVAQHYNVERLGGSGTVMRVLVAKAEGR